MKRRCACLILIPAGPGTDPGFLADTLESVNHYIGAAESIIAIIDDSGAREFHHLAYTHPNVLVLDAADYSADTNSSPLVNGPLFGKEIRALRTLVREHAIAFDVLLKMDTDTLVTGSSPHHDAIGFFADNPGVGIVGAFTRRGNGEPKLEAMAEKGRQLRREMSVRHGLKNLRLMMTLRRLHTSARRTRYRLGETCTGGGYFMSRRLVEVMDRLDYLALEQLRYSHLGEDSLMGLIAAACGFHLSDFPPSQDILAVNWRGFPMPLAKVIERNKKILHPVRANNPAVEPRVREWFRAQRETLRVLGKSSAEQARGNRPSIKDSSGPRQSPGAP